MEILTVPQINPTSPSLFLGPNSPSREKSPQPKLHSKPKQFAKISSNLQYVPKKPSSVSAEPKSDFSNSVISNAPNDTSTTVPPAANNAASPSKATTIGKSKKIPKKTAAVAKKKVPAQPSSTPSKSSAVQNTTSSSSSNNSNKVNNNVAMNNNSPKKTTRAPLSTIYDSTSNTPKRAEYRPVSKKNNSNVPDKPDEISLNKLLTLPPSISPKPNMTLESIPVLPLSLDPLPAQVPLPASTSTSTPPATDLVPLPDERSSLAEPVHQPPKQKKVYTINQLVAIGRLPICSVPHSGKSPAEIIEDYNLQYAQQEKEMAKLLQEDEKFLYKAANYSLHSSYPFISTSYDSGYANLSNSANFFYSNGNNNSFRSCSVDGLNNAINNNNNNNNIHNLNNPVFPSPPGKNKKTAWIPRKSADSIDTSSSPDSLNFSSLHLDQSQPRIAPHSKAPTVHNLSKSCNYYNSPAYYNGNNYTHSNQNHDFLLHSSQRVPVIHSTEYEEADQNENSDEEGLAEENLLGYSIPREISPKRLESRQKQIDIGKNTPGYKNYVQVIKKEKRKYYDPHTPDKYQICSKRSWDGQIRVWRRLLHLYDSKQTDHETEIKKE
jgi:hypothetical protein